MCKREAGDGPLREGGDEHLAADLPFRLAAVSAATRGELNRSSDRTIRTCGDGSRRFGRGQTSRLEESSDRGLVDEPYPHAEDARVDGGEKSAGLGRGEDQS